MATQVQFRGGSTAQNNAFTGASKELTVDTDKDVVVVHDGATAGGHPLMAEDGSNSALASGTAGTPALKFDGTSTGIYSPGADQVAISTNGTQQVTVDGAGRLLVGTANSIRSEKLQIFSTDNDHLGLIGGDQTAQFVFARSSDTAGGAGIVANNDFISRIEFSGNDGAFYRRAASIEVAVDGTPGAGDMPGRIVLSTTPSGSVIPQERLRITSDGKLGLGTSSPSELLHVQTGSDGSVQIGADGGSQFASKIFNPASTIKLESTVSDVILSSARHFVFQDETGSPFGRWASSGRLGIGTSDPKDAFHVEAASPVLRGVDAGNNATAKIDFGSGNITLDADAFATAASSIINFQIDGSEAARIDSSGRLLVGASGDFQIGSTNSAIQVRGTGPDTAGLSISRFSDNGASGYLSIGKARGSIATPTIVNADDIVGTIQFAAYDGASLATEAAQITAEVDGTPGTDDMPGRLVFSVTADGSASPTEAMRIKNSRVINFSNAPVYADNAAAKTGGLVDGDVYRTSTGDLKIVYT